MSRRSRIADLEAPAATGASGASGERTIVSLPGRLRRERLDNGLEVCLIDNRQAPLVTSVLYYRAGTRDEPAGHGGVAHFLEHMMFKGSGLYGPGEIDRKTQALGGVNNAFTSHDTTAYHFNFAADRWTEALAIEADRMAALTLDPADVASERQVILEEIAMYASEPWDALEMEVQARLYGSHVYGRPVLGTKEALLATGPEDLAAFHRRYYRPENAVLVLAGELDSRAMSEVEKTLGAVTPTPWPAAGQPDRPAAGDLDFPRGLARIERHKGEVPRLLLALPGPAGDHPDHPALRLLVTLLASGRASRLHRAMVDEDQICVWVAAELAETQEAGQITLGAEVVPGVPTERVEADLFRHLADLRERPPSAEEVERAKQIVRADWVFGHEKVHQQALSAGFALTLFDLGYLDRHLAAVLKTTPEALHEMAVRYLNPETSAVLGWSLREGA